MTFSRYVTVYELVNSMFMKSIIIDGKEKITIEDIVKMLSFDKKGDVNRYVQNVAASRNYIIEVIENLQPDPWICLQKGRYERVTYNSLQTCLTIANSIAHNGARIVACIGGASTVGEGAVASLNKEEIIRAQFDLDEETEKLKVFTEASKIY